MGFELQGYEKDNNYTMFSFFLYTGTSIVILIIITFLLLFYFFIEREKMYDKVVLQDEIVSTTEYKEMQLLELNSKGEYLDLDKRGVRIPIDDAITKAINETA